MKFNSKQMAWFLLVIIIIIVMMLLLFDGSTTYQDKNKPTFSPDDTALVLLRDIVPDILTDVRYATTNNFTKRQIYPDDLVFVRKIVADSLKAVQEELRLMGLSLKVYDAFRPLSVQKIMWAILPDTNFVADPKLGSKHNRGAAVDLTITDSAGNELDMGTAYDDFTEKANSSYSNFNSNILNNRKLLKTVMERSGFTQLRTEWWHFDFRNWQSFSILSR
jgi:D-alanyl-D-alanine dipeptidase